MESDLILADWGYTPESDLPLSWAEKVDGLYSLGTDNESGSGDLIIVVPLVVLGMTILSFKESSIS